MAFAVLKPSQAARRGERYAVSARSDKAGTVSCSSAVLASARSPTRAVAGFRCGCTTLPCGSPYATPPRSRRRRRQYPQRCHVGFTWETTMKDVRGQQKAEREFL